MVEYFHRGPVVLAVNSDTRNQFLVSIHTPARQVLS